MLFTLGLYNPEIVQILLIKYNNSLRNRKGPSDWLLRACVARGQLGQRTFLLLWGMKVIPLSSARFKIEYKAGSRFRQKDFENAPGGI